MRPDGATVGLIKGSEAPITTTRASAIPAQYAVATPKKTTPTSAPVASPIAGWEAAAQMSARAASLALGLQRVGYGWAEGELWRQQKEYWS